MFCKPRAPDSVPTNVPAPPHTPLPGSSDESQCVRCGASPPAPSSSRSSRHRATYTLHRPRTSFAGCWARLFPPTRRRNPTAQSQCRQSWTRSPCRTRTPRSFRCSSSSRRRMTHHMFLKGQTNPVQRQTRNSLVKFHGADAGTLVRLSAAIPGLRSSTTHPFDRMLGYPTVFIDCMLRANGHSRARILFTPRLFLLLAALFAAFGGPCAGIVSAQQVRFPARKGGVANLEAKTQSRKGDVTTADGDVDIQYADTRLRADHVEYNGKTYEAVATGHVHLDYNNEHIDADEAHYNVSTGHGLFHNVRGDVKIERRPNPDVLVTDNPLYFEARDVERFAGDVYLVHRAWITICDPEHPKWQFYAPHARIRLDKTAALINANFRLFRVPLIWLPYATAPTGRRVRQSGFLIPDIGQSSRRASLLV